MSCSNRRTGSFKNPARSRTLLVTNSIHSHTYENGLVLLAETMDWVESAAFALLLPAGYVHDPAHQLGVANFTCEMVQRGCGDRDSHQFVEDLDRLGVDRSVSVAAAHTSFGGATLADNLFDSLSIYADLVRKPILPTDQLEEGRQVCFQELWSLEDDLARKTMMRLKERFYGDPWGRSSYGTRDHLEAISIEQIVEHTQQCYRPSDAILSVAGKVDWEHLRDQIEGLFGDWSSRTSHPIPESPATRGYEHVSFDSSQTQIGVAYESVPYAHPDYFQARAAVGILSDGMSSRLFTEIRENRGLCYSVYASCHSLRSRGSVLCYAATSTERSQETLDVMLSELKRMKDGVRKDELDRLKARLKSSLIMQQESSSARSSSMAADWFHLGRVMAMDEVGKIIDELSCDSINAFLEKNAPETFTVVTLGEKKLEVPIGIS
ncbi:MAG: insulinase family protein [Planctomycetaceae bacterium]|nr:insulinase family protein [Planctomycetaceae bacterium]